MMTWEHFINYYLRLYWFQLAVLLLLGINTAMLTVLAFILRKINNGGKAKTQNIASLPPTIEWM